MFWLLSLLIIRITYFWTMDFPWKSLIIDAGLGASLIYLFRSHQISRAFEAWYYLRRRSHQIMKRQFNLAIASDLLRLISIPFALLWLLRWKNGFDGVFSTPPTQYQFNCIDAFLFCLLLAYMLDTGLIRRWLFRMKITSGRQVLIQYAIAILAGTFLLEMPTSLQSGQALSLLDSMFITISALSVTGLSPVDVGTVLSFSGQMILLVLIQLGGLGIVLITAGFSFITFRRLSLNSILLGREMYSTCRTGEIPEFLTRVVTLTVLIEMIGTLCLYWSLPADTPNRLFTAIFHSVSAFCNAGFSTFSTGLHQTPFSSFGIVAICLLIILGGLGFPIFLELWSSFVKREKKFSILSAHTKLTLMVMFTLLIVGPILFFILETVQPSTTISLWNRMGNSLFYSISSRTAGFGMIPISTFQPAALFWLLLLMIIGANPSSTGGGIKTTTLGILITCVVRTIQGRHQTTFHRRSIPSETINRALTVIVLYLFTAGLAMMFLSITEKIPVFSMCFEVFSALSTVGLSMDVTSKLSIFGKIVIMFLMLFGRIGILSFLLAGVGHISKSKVQYPEDDFFVG